MEEQQPNLTEDQSLNQPQQEPEETTPPKKQMPRQLAIGLAVASVAGYLFLSYLLGIWPYGSLLEKLPEMSPPVQLNDLGSPPAENNGNTACTLEAKLCPDGSAVGRTGPNCEFAPCPGEEDMSSWQTYRNEEYGFEFKYPEDWKNIGSQGVISFQKSFTEPPPDDNEMAMGNYCKFGLYINTEDYEKFIEKFRTDPFLISLSETKLGDRNAIRTVVNEIGPVIGVHVFLSATQVLSINLLCGEVEGTQDKGVVDFNQILSTFNFLD